MQGTAPCPGPGRGVSAAEGGPALPPGGFVIPLPDSLAGMTAEMNGQPAQIENGELRVQKLPVSVRLSQPL